MGYRLTTSSKYLAVVQRPSTTCELCVRTVMPPVPATSLPRNSSYMKLTIVKRAEFPKDVSEDFVPVWEAFLKMRAVSQLRVLENAEDAVPECFRILLNQAGAKIQLQHTVNEFVKLPELIRRLKKFAVRGNILDHMRVTKHSQTLAYTSAEPVCAIYNPTFVGILVLQPQRFTLSYLIERMQGLVYKTMPYPLASKMPNGDPKKQRKLNALKDSDYWVAFDAPDLKIMMARTDKELVVKYEIKPRVIVPMYAKIDGSLKAIWRKSISGVFA